MKILNLIILTLILFSEIESQNLDLKFNGFILPTNDGTLTTYGLGLEYQPKGDFSWGLYYQKSIQDETPNDGYKNEIAVLTANARKYFSIETEKISPLINGQIGYGNIKVETGLLEFEDIYSRGILLGLGLGIRINLSERWSIENIMLPRYFISTSNEQITEITPIYDKFSLRFEFNCNFRLVK